MKFILDIIPWLIVFGVNLHLLKLSIRFYLKEEEKAEIRERGEWLKRIQEEKNKR